VLAHFLYGLELGKTGSATEAAEQFRDAVRIMPDFAEARLNLGVALANETNYSGALVQFEAVLKSDPSNAVALHYAQTVREKLSAAPSH